MRSTRLSACFLLPLLLAVTVPANAETSILDEWAAESFGERVGDVINSGIAAAQEKGRMQAEILRARSAFRSAKPGSTEYRKAGKDLANLLFGKDLYYLGLFVAEGVTEQSKKRVLGLDWMTGGQLDGGINPSAQVPFARWVDGVRTSLGQPRNGQMLFVTSPTALVGAIQANMPLYGAYRVERDRQELGLPGQPGGAGGVPFSPSQKSPAGVGPHGDTVLSSSEVTDVYLGVIGFPGRGLSPEARRRFDTESRALASSGQKILTCVYRTPRDTYVTYEFWYGGVPASAASLRALDPTAEIRFLGNTPLEKCPIDANTAVRIRQTQMGILPK